MTQEKTNRIFDNNFWKWTLPLLTIMFFVGTIHLWSDFFRNQDTYEHQTGIVNSLKIDTVYKMRDVDYPLQIKIENSEEPYFLSDDFTNYFDKVLNNVIPRDKISITYDNGMFDLGSQNNIREITKDGQTIFDKELSKTNTLWTAIFVSVGTILFGLLTIKKRK